MKMKESLKPRLAIRSRAFKRYRWQLMCQLGGNIWGNIWDEIKIECDDEFGDQLWHRLKSSIEIKMRNQI